MMEREGFEVVLVKSGGARLEWVSWK